MTQCELSPLKVALCQVVVPSQIADVHAALHEAIQLAESDLLERKTASPDKLPSAS